MFYKGQTGFVFCVRRFRDLGVSFSSFACFVLRFSFSSASFSNLPLWRGTFLRRVVREALGSVTTAESGCRCTVYLKLHMLGE